ncbi:MAG TPA: efflux RND transporter permease subunit [Gemmataceae bacterium]|jgi:multidrug efflux pump subunit AcrB|nr:efflux RND transporter permease subunit [Gemmataceae bacterium]
MWLIKASLRNPYMVASIVFMILVLGALSITRIPIDILPVFKAPAVQVITYYQGMPASSIEKTLTNRIERWVNQAPGASLVESKSIPGVSIVRVYFRDDTDPTAALAMTSQLALGTLPTLPPNTLPPIVLPFDPTATMPLGVLTVENKNLDEANIKDVARIQVRNFLGAVPGCIAPVVVGGKDRTVLVYLDPKKMEARHVSMLDVVAALKQGNMMVTPGIAYFGNNQLLLDTNMMVEKVKELNDLPIRVDPANSIYLRDIGRAEDSFAIQSSRVRIDGSRQVYVPIYRQQGASSLAVVNGVKEKLEYIIKRCPPGTKLTLVMDQSIFVRESIHSLIEEGVIGAILVSIMILIFLGNWRMTLIASMSIPLAILGAIIGLYLTGNTINALTLGGLALAIGPLVDDAIVELENNHRNYSMGKSRIRAALDGCAEVMVPVLVATCTTNIVLAPLALMPGMGGFLFRPLALAVTFAMVSSFLLSRTFVPMMCAKFLPDEHQEHQGDPHGHAPPTSYFGRVHRRIERGLDAANRSYIRQLELTMRHPYKLLGFVVFLIVLAGFLSLHIGREFFPKVDAGQITMYVRCPSNLRLDASEKRVMEVEDLIRQVVPAKDLKKVVSEMGVDPDWSSAYTENSGQQDTVIRIQLSEEREFSSQEYAAKLRKAFKQEERLSDLRVSFNTGGMVSTALNNGAASPIDIQIEGGKQSEALKVAREVRNRVRTIPGVADARVRQRLDAPYLVIDVDRQKAARAGLTPNEVIEQAVAALNSSISIDRNFWIDVKTGNQYFVAVQYPDNPGMKLEDLLNIEATGVKQTTPVKLSSLAKFHRTTGAVELNHVALMPVFNVQLNTEGRDIAGVAVDVEKAIADIRNNLPEGMFITFKGEFERMNESFWNLLNGMVLATVLVYLLQVALFRSWVGPLIIMCTVPLGLIGVVFMLYLTNTTLNVQSEMGAIFLVGIEVNTGVLIVEFANKQRKLGLSVRDAVLKACSVRFRPIIMTFLACFIDLLPMAFGMGGRGSEANVPLARAVVGGLLCSTLLSRFVLPVLYTMLIRDGKVGEQDIEAELADLPEPMLVPPVNATPALSDSVILPDGTTAKGPPI